MTKTCRIGSVSILVVRPIGQQKLYGDACTPGHRIVVAHPSSQIPLRRLLDQRESEPGLRPPPRAHYAPKGALGEVTASAKSSPQRSGARSFRSARGV